MRIFLYGKDNLGWSIDSDRYYTERFLKGLNHKISTNPCLSQIIHCVWWNQLFEISPFLLKHKTVLAVVTNSIDSNNTDYQRIKPYVDIWIAASKRQFQFLESDNVKTYYQPFYCDENTFFPLSEEKDEIAKKLGISYSQLHNKTLIGSFFRDSLGSDLSQPKLQKNPELLIQILKKLPKDKYVLLLSGPRRHWVIQKCKEHEIPYVFVGKEPKLFVDDISYNVQTKATMNLLYNLSDIILVTSSLEGGPKSIIEGSLCKKLVLSTDVGLAPDFLDPWCIFSTISDVLEKISECKTNPQIIEKIVSNNYFQTISIGSYSATETRWKNIYESMNAKYLII